MKNFAIIGVGGYIAPRHIEAIHHIGGRLVVAFDPNDSVGVLDRYTRDVNFFTDLELFEEFISSQKGTENEINYISICSPNFLHFSHIKFSLEMGADVICEKPLVLTVNEVLKLKEIENKTNQRVYTVLQLRLHEAIQSLKRKVSSHSHSDKYEIELTYLTSRGPWYHQSWKGSEDKSGGLATNIGIHFFDMLQWIFGSVEKNILFLKDKSINSGYLELSKARVKWALSVDQKYLPVEVKEAGGTTFRSMQVNGEEFEFSKGFTDLHNRVYEHVLAENGFSLEESKTAILIVEELRKAKENPLNLSLAHPMLKENFDEQL